METRYLRISYEDSISGKKQLLSTQLNLLNTVKRVHNYTSLRKSELTKKRKLQTALRELRTKIKSFMSTLPKEELSTKEIRKKLQKKKEKKEDLNLQEQLQEIREKLEKLQ